MLGDWFDYPLGQHKMFLIPLAFEIPDSFDASALAKESDSHRRLLEYIAKQEASAKKSSKHSISLVVDVQFKRNTTGIPVHTTTDSGASININSEEQFQKKYPWSWDDKLRPEIKKRYSNFSQNKAFWKLKKEIEQNPAYSGERFLDWNNKTGLKKRFYSPEILKEFDKHYVRKNP